MSDKYAVSNKLPAKQVSILAHRKKRQREEKSHDRVKQLNRKFRLTKKKRDFIKPEALIMAYRRSERDERRMNRCIQSEKIFKKPNATQNILVAYRHRAHKIASSATNRILKRLRLNMLHNATILKNNIETTAMLRLVEPYVTWGYPTVDTVRDLVFKYGFLLIEKKKVPMNCNKLIEENLGTLGIICVEDIVHELFTTSKNFYAVQKTLLPFKLKAPKEGWKHKTGVSFAKGGEYGFRKDNINQLIQECI